MPEDLTAMPLRHRKTAIDESLKEAARNVLIAKQNGNNAEVLLAQQVWLTWQVLAELVEMNATERTASKNLTDSLGRILEVKS